MFRMAKSYEFVSMAHCAHIRTYQSALLKMTMKPTSSKAKQVG